ncbi:MAG TPA: PilZ domain-containing protein [Thermoanaerobaculia bacterium]
MSAIELSPLPTDNRRTAERLRINSTVPVIFGRGGGVLVDLSQRGARIRHAGSVRRGALVRVSFVWERNRISGTAEVLASRVVNLGSGASYETRVRFTKFDGASESALANALEGIAGRDVRRLVANLHGWTEETPTEELAPKNNGTFVRCRLRGAWWERKNTNDATQPEDGFLLPADSTESDVAKLCDIYSRATNEERHFIRITAAAVVEQSRL